MRKRALNWIGMLAAAGVMAGSAVALSTPTAYAEVTCHGKPVTKVITENKDDQTHYGTSGEDVVLLKGSAWQTFYAKGGDDTVCVQGYGSDVYGGSGNDWITGEKSEGICGHGGSGDDTITGSQGWDEISGGTGDDILRGLGGDDGIAPDLNDLLDDTATEDGADVVDAGAGADQVTVWHRKAGDTTGKDDLKGGAGGDSLSINGVPTKINVAQGTARASAGGPTDHFAGFENYYSENQVDITGGPGSDSFSILGKKSRLDAQGGRDEIYVDAGHTVINAGNGNDYVEYNTKRRGNKISLGSGDDEIYVMNAKGPKVTGGPGDDAFKLRTHGDDGEDEGSIYGTQTGRFKGQSGSDTLSWDCKSNVDVNKNRLSCTHGKAKINFSGMQVYRAVRWGNHDFNDTFRGSPHADVFYGGLGDDLMYGRKGRDELIGGTGQDTAHGGPAKDVCHAERKFRC